MSVNQIYKQDQEASEEILRLHGLSAYNIFVYYEGLIAYETYYCMEQQSLRHDPTYL